MVNLSKCDKCGNRNILCFVCNDNKHYREWKYSHDRAIKHNTIDEFVTQIKNNLITDYSIFDTEDIRLFIDVVEDIAKELKNK